MTAIERIQISLKPYYFFSTTTVNIGVAEYLTCSSSLKISLIYIFIYSNYINPNLDKLFLSHSGLFSFESGSP